MSKEDYFELVEGFLSDVQEIRRLERELSEGEKSVEDEIILRKRYQTLYDAYGGRVMGTPEDFYLDNLFSEAMFRYDPSLEDLGFLRFRTLNGLGIRKVSELQELSESDLFRLPNIGMGTLKEIKDFLKNKGLKLKD